jgi:hypothetical protein
MARCIGEILVALDEHNVREAEEWARKAIAADQRNGLMLHLGRDLKFQADMLYRRRENHAALEAVKRSVEIFKGCGALRDLQEAERMILPKG